MFLRKYGVATHIYIPVIKRGVVDFALGADWTPQVSGTFDARISKDGGASANLAGTPVAISMGNGALWDFPISNTEMQAAQVVVTIVDATAKAIEDQSFIIETYGNASALHSGVDWTDGVRLGLTALPNAVAGANTGLPIVGTQIPNATAAANGGLVTCDANNSVKIQGNVKKSAALNNFLFLLTDSTNHNPATGKAGVASATRSIDGSSFVGGTLGTVTEIGNGIYSINFAGADLAGNNIILRVTATGCDDTFERLVTYV